MKLICMHLKVHGYQETIFEAMNVMENAQIVPTVDSYNCVIYAFSEACELSAFSYLLNHKLVIINLK
jgi:hypothetical protein